MITFPCISFIGGIFFLLAILFLSLSLSLPRKLCPRSLSAIASVGMIGRRQAGATLGSCINRDHLSQYWMLSKTGEIRRDESCLDYSGSDVILYPCHGSKGNQQWIYNPQVIHFPSRHRRSRETDPETGSKRRRSREGILLLLFFFFFFFFLSSRARRARSIGASFRYHPLRLSAFRLITSGMAAATSAWRSRRANSNW